MNNSILNSLRNACEGIAELCEKYRLEGAPLIDYIDGRISDMKPMVIFYGLYNSGKSSTLNALAGSLLAPVSDRPETMKVTAYHRGHYILVDSPGIDAPAEHEKLSREAVEKADVVLFVISTMGMFDEELVSAEIVRLIGLGKNVIVVLNKKCNFEEGGKSYLEITGKLSKNIICAAEKIGMKKELLTENYDLVVINSKSALKARNEGNALLLAHSNILALESLIENRVANCSMAVMVSNAVSYLEREHISRLEAAIGAASSCVKTKALIECSDHLINKKRASLAKIKRECSALVEEYLDGAEGRGEELNSRVRETIGAIVGEAYNGSVEYISGRIGSDLEAGNRLTKDPCHGLSCPEDGLSNDAAEGAPEALNLCSGKPKAPAMIKAVVNGKTIRAGARALGRGVKLLKNSKMIGKGMAKAMKGLFKGLERFAGPISAGIDVLIAIYEYGEARRRDEIEKERAGRAALAARAKARQLRVSYMADLMASAENFIGEVFADIDALVERERSLFEKAEMEAMADHEKLHKLRNELISLPAANVQTE